MTAKEFTDRFLPLKDAFYRVAFYIMESQDDAMDAVQDLYVKLWNSLDTLDSVNNPKAYGIMILKNLCIDRVRKAARHQTEELKEDVGLVPDSVTDIVHKEALTRTLKAMQELPPNQRMVLHMKVFEDLSYEEISKKTGINNLTLRVMLSNVRKKLKSKI